MNSCGKFKNYEKLSSALVGATSVCVCFAFLSFLQHEHAYLQRTELFSLSPIYSNRWHCRYRSSSSSTVPHIFQVICPNECIFNISFVSLISFKCTTNFFAFLLRAHHQLNGDGRPHERHQHNVCSQSSLIYAIYSSTRAQLL